MERGEAGKGREREGQEALMPLVLWFFEVKTARGRWRQLRWMMTDEDAEQYAARNSVELRKLEHTREERNPSIDLAPSLSQRVPGK